MFEQYKDKFMIWQLHNRKEITKGCINKMEKKNIKKKKYQVVKKEKV